MNRLSSDWADHLSVEDIEHILAHFTTSQTSYSQDIENGVLLDDREIAWLQNSVKVCTLRLEAWTRALDAKRNGLPIQNIVDTMSRIFG